MRTAVQTALLFVCWGLAWGTAGAAERPELVSLENNFFEVVGPDYESVAAVGRLGRHVVATSFRLLGEPERPLPRKVLVVLGAEKPLPFEGDYRIRIDPRGYVTLEFAWTASLGLENTIYALSRAFLIQYAYSIFGPAAPPSMRAWPVSTVSSVAYLRLRPAQAATFAEEARSSNLPSAVEVLGRPLASVPTGQADRAGYWVWSLLRRDGGMPARRFEILMEGALQGGDAGAPIAEFVNALGTGRSGVGLDEWWRTGLLAELSQPIGPFEGLAGSEGWLAALADFSGLEAVQADAPVGLRDLWTLREDEALRDVLEARLEILRLGLDRVNPAYFNSAQSLGVLFETVLRGERKFEFIGALTAFLSDFEDTRRLHEAVERELDGDS